MKKLHLICNAHLDPVWQWTLDEGVSAAISTFKSAADLAEEFDYVFCHNEAFLYETIERLCPELFERIKKLVAAGKWRIMGGWYIQPDCLLPSGESIIRQITTGNEYFEKKFGVKTKVANNFDSFGHSLGLVQLLAKNGYVGYLHCRPYPWQRKYKGRFYKWTAPNGDSVISGRGAGSYGALLGDAVGKIKRELPEIEDVDYVLWGVGNHGGGPSRKDLNDIAELKIPGVKIFHSNPDDLFSDEIEISEETCESLVTCMPGCYSSMARIKEAHREAENMLYSTEKLISAAALAGYAPKEDNLLQAQKALLLAEFHDILPGTCVEDGEKEGLDLLSYCRKITRDERTAAFTYLVKDAGVAKEGEFPIFVFNPMPYETTVPVEAEFMGGQNWEDYGLHPAVFADGKRIPVQAIKESSTLNIDWRKRVIFDGKLKPFSLTRFSAYLEKGEIINGDKINKYEAPAVAADETSAVSGGALSSPVSLEVYDDTADPWGMSDAELIRMGENPKPFRMMTEEECREFIVSSEPMYPVHVIEDGAVMKSTECFLTDGKSNAVVEYRNYKNHGYTDVKVTVEYAEKNKMIKLKIPCPEGVPAGDGPYLVENKPKSGEIYFQKWAGVKKNDGKIFAVINDRCYGGSINGGYIYISLLRGAAFCTHPVGRKLYPTDRYLPRIENGRYVFRFRIFEGSADEVCREAECFNQKFYTLNAFPTGDGKQCVRVETDAPALLAAAKPHNGGALFRFFNPEDKEKTFGFSVGGEKTTVKMSPYDVVTVIYDGKFTVISDKTPV